jgi:hypothetical protein
MKKAQDERPRFRVVAYVTEREHATIQREATRKRQTISMYARSRLLPSDDDEPTEAAQGIPVGVIARILKAMGAVGDKQDTLMVMVDQMVRFGVGAHHQEWQKQVEAILRTMREQHTNGNEARG